MRRRRLFCLSFGFLAFILTGCSQDRIPTAATPVATTGPQARSIPASEGEVTEVADPGPFALVQSFTIDQPRVRGGDTAVGSIVLQAPAPVGGTLVKLSSSDRDVRPPDTITIPAGSSLGMFQIPTSEPHADTEVFLTADAQGEVHRLPIVLLLPVPGAHGDSYAVEPGGTLVVRAPGILDNDVRRRGHDLTAVLSVQPLSGEVALAADGGFTYRPAPGFTGVDRFIYRPVDGEVAGDQGTVTITVSARQVTDPPTAPPLPPAPGATLSVTGSPLLLASGGASRSVTVTNTSFAVAATSVGSVLAGTALAGHVAETANTCGASLAPFASCTLSFTGVSAVAMTTFAIQGGNTNTVVGAIEVATIAVGAAFRGGIIFELNGDGVSGKLAATADNSAGIAWGGAGIATGAQSDANGTGNTVTAVTVLGNNGGAPYAAQTCDALSVTSGGVTYTDWYLPAKDELNALFINRVVIGGFTGGIYWSSTEHSAVPTGNSWAQLFAGGIQGFSGKTNTNLVRCVRAF
jgi:hypothetical protein